MRSIPKCANYTTGAILALAVPLRPAIIAGRGTK